MIGNEGLPHAAHCRLRGFEKGPTVTPSFDPQKRRSVRERYILLYQDLCFMGEDMKGRWWTSVSSSQTGITDGSEQ
jgi:hypothetical protein